MSKRQRRLEKARQAKYTTVRAATRVVVDEAAANIDWGAGHTVIVEDTIVRPPDAPAAGGHGEVPVPVVAAKSPGITWDDVIGQEEAKAALIDAIETPIVHADLFRAYGQRHSKGVLLYGPPGCGKTLLAKAAAASFAALQPKVIAKAPEPNYYVGIGFMFGPPQAARPASDDAFIYLKGPELKSMWHGKTEENIRDLFTRARNYHKATGCRSLVFVDEAETLMGHRDTIGQHSVPTFLAEMDGLSDNGPFLILATNRQDALDPAIVRPGRIDRKIEVKRPTQDDARDILALNLRHCVVQQTIEEISDRAAASLYSGQHVVHAFNGPNGVAFNFTLDRLVSGAVVAGIVRQAIAVAMRRDISCGASVPSGVSHADMDQAIASACEAEKKMNHSDEIGRWAAEMAIDHIKSCSHCGGTERQAVPAN